MQSTSAEQLSLNDPITSLDAEIVRLAGVIAKALADRIKASLKAELAGFVPEVTTIETATPHEPPAQEAISAEVDEAIAGIEATSAQEANPTSLHANIRTSWRAELEGAEGIPEDVRENIGAFGDVYELACKAVDGGIRAEEIETYVTQASELAGEILAPEDAAVRIALFRSAVSFETRERKREEKERRATEANARRVQKMANRRERIAAQQDKRRKEIDNLLGKPQESTPQPAPTVIEIKPVSDAIRKAVVVVGLLPAQADMIRREFQAGFELAFYDTEHLGRMTNILPHADVVILMTDFISHSHSDLFDKLARLIRVPGGMSSIRKALRDFYQESYLSAKGA